jgi:small subunit ribosomal protein S27Ae
MGKKEKKADKKGKKIRKGRKHESIKTWKKYEVKGEAAQAKNSFCPRCGPGTFLSMHKNRQYCGKCGYTNFKSAATAHAPQEKQ